MLPWAGRWRHCSSSTFSSSTPTCTSCPAFLMDLYLGTSMLRFRPVAVKVDVERAVARRLCKPDGPSRLTSDSTVSLIQHPRHIAAREGSRFPPLRRRYTSGGKHRCSLYTPYKCCYYGKTLPAEHIPPDRVTCGCRFGAARFRRCIAYLSRLVPVDGPIRCLLYANSKEDVRVKYRYLYPCPETRLLPRRCGGAR